MRLHFITALSQKKNNILPRLLKPSQFLLLTQEDRANSFADQAELGGVLWSWGRTKQEGMGEKFGNRWKTSAMKLAPELTASGCESCSSQQHALTPSPQPTLKQ